MPSQAMAPFPSPISNVFVRDLKAQTPSLTLASATTGGQLANAFASGLSFSPDSRSLFFESNAIDLTSNPPDTTSAPVPLPVSAPVPLPVQPFGLGLNSDNLFVRDLAAGTTSLISATTDGKLSGSISANAFLSRDGQTLYFDSSADNLTAGDSNHSTDIFAASAPFTASNQFHFSSWESAAQESDGQVMITVLRSGPATGAASVNYAVQDGSAQAGTDFNATSGTLNFAAGEAAKTFTVPLVSGDHFAGTRSAVLVLSNPQGANLGYPSALLNLTADPAPPSPAPVTPLLPGTMPASAMRPGPTVVSVTALKGRRGVSSLVITFDRALDPTSAQNLANYQVSLPGRTLHIFQRHQTATRPGRPLAISAAAYDPASHQVTLTLHTRLRQRQAYQLRVKGTAGGVIDTSGTPLNSPNPLKPGQDDLTAVDLVARQG
jgi:hypothetical protein